MVAGSSAFNGPFGLVLQHTGANYDAGARLLGQRGPSAPERRGFRGVRRGFAVGLGEVYCFLSRREGDSEELATGTETKPQIQDQILVALLER